MKRSHLYSLILFLVLLLIPLCYQLYLSPYQMCVLVPADGPDDAEWPDKKLWFDASKWLKQPQYIKINDYDLINTQYKPIEDLNSFFITNRLLDGIKSWINLHPQLAPLTRMDELEFNDYMQNRLSYEYLYTTFDKETLTPIKDHFLIFFTYNNVDYEIEMQRKPYKNGFYYRPYGHVEKAGYWHKQPLEYFYSYQDYLAGKPIPTANKSGR